MTDLRSLKISFPKIRNRIIGKISREYYSAKDRFKTGLLGSFEQTEIRISPRLKLDKSFYAEIPGTYYLPVTVIRHYLSHEFDILGSGWTSFNLINKTPPPAVTNRSDKKEIARIKERISKNYRPINWQIDVKSGFQWSSIEWSKNIKIGNQPGVDIKVPWELARMQHLPQMALFYLLSDKTTEPAVLIPDEFKNEVLDFISANPPGFGVNWLCAMDVGIRCANLLLAYDLLNAAGYLFDSDFMKIFSSCIYAHATHISRNLEWSKEYQGNHYLSDIVGLLWAAAYLESTPKTDSFLLFGIQELKDAFKKQFFEEGTNNEGSTAYHRLCTEMIIYATALILGLPAERVMCLSARNKTSFRFGPRLRNETVKEVNPHKDPLYIFFGNDFFNKLSQAVLFTQNTSDCHGEIIQVGDNDSGRLFKIEPVYEKFSKTALKQNFQNLNHYPDSGADYYFENTLHSKHIINAAGGFLMMPQNVTLVQKQISIEQYIVSRIARIGIANVFSGKEKISHDTGEEEERKDFEEQFLKAQELFKKTFVFDISKEEQYLAAFSYPAFGIFLFRNEQTLILIRCGGLYDGYGAHLHNDQLTVSIHDSEKKIIDDPGTYLYTSDPASRNSYRSVQAHFAPQSLGIEPENLDKGVFFLPKTATAQCLLFKKNYFLGVYKGMGFHFMRAIEVKDQKVIIKDLSFQTILGEYETGSVPVSPGYGWKESALHPFVESL